MVSFFLVFFYTLKYILFKLSLAFLNVLTFLWHQRVQSVQRMVTWFLTHITHYRPRCHFSSCSHPKHCGAVFAELPTKTAEGPHQDGLKHYLLYTRMLLLRVLLTNN